MKLSIHNVIRGKPSMAVNLDGTKWMESCGQRVNLGYGWLNVDLPWPDVFELITADGCATSAELIGSHRSDDDFVSRELLMVDIDSGMTIEELLQDNFYNEYGAGFYATPSHTIDKHRFRIMFRCEQPVQDREQIKRLIMALMRVYDHADIACKDSTRIFYGTVNCEYKECRDKLLPTAMIEVLLSMEEQFRIEQQRQFDYEVEHQPLTDLRRQGILDLLKTCFVGEYPIWRNIGWGLKNAGFELKDFQYVTQGMMNQKTAQDAATLWNAARPITGERCTLGTVIYFLKQRLGEEFMRQFWQETSEKNSLVMPKPTSIDANTGAKIYTGISALQVLRNEMYKTRSTIRNG